jgi:predicted component of type VI protein secretion system
MNTTELHALLDEVHAQLAHPDQLTEDKRSLLLHIRDDVDALLGKEAASPPTEETPQVRLEQAVAEFEGSHPTLAVALQKVLDTLSQSGI